MSGARPLILMLSAAHPPDDLRVVRKEGAALASAGWRVRHLCPLPASGAAPPGDVAGVEIETYRRRPSWRGRLLGLLPLARRAVCSGAAAIHASEPDAWLAAILAARFCGARVVLDVHEHYPSRLDARLPPPLRLLARGAIHLFCRLAARTADAVVVAKDGLDADFAAPAKTIAVRNYAATEAAPEPRRHAPGPITLVHLGAIGRARGWPVMLEALALCPPETRLLLIGRFTDGSEAEFAARAEALGLSARVVCTGWLPYPAALARAAAQGDIGLVLFQPGVENHRLALPHKLFDCMLAGLPVIAPAFAEEVATVVREAGCGELVDASDPQAVAASVARLSDPGRRAALGDAGRRAATGRFGWPAEAARLVALHRHLLRGEARLHAPALLPP